MEAASRQGGGAGGHVLVYRVEAMEQRGLGAQDREWKQSSVGLLRGRDHADG